jgi:hypothetical protein
MEARSIIAGASYARTGTVYDRDGEAPIVVRKPTRPVKAVKAVLV